MIKSRMRLLNMWFGFVLIFSSGMIFVNTFSSTPLIDYTYQMENAYRIYCGQVPYKDFFLVLMPGTYYVMALFMYLFKLSNIGMTALVILDHLLRLTLFYLIMRKITTKKVMMAFLLLLCSLSDAAVYPYPNYNFFFVTFMLLYICYDLYVIDNNVYRKYQIIIAGYLVTIPFLFKQNYGLFFAIGIYVIWIYRSLVAKRICVLLYAMVGTLVSGGIFLIYLLQNDIKLSDFLYPVFFFSAQKKMSQEYMHPYYMG